MKRTTRVIAGSLMFPSHSHSQSRPLTTSPPLQRTLRRLEHGHASDKSANGGDASATTRFCSFLASEVWRCLMDLLPNVSTNAGRRWLGKTELSENHIEFWHWWVESAAQNHVVSASSSSDRPPYTQDNWPK